MITRRKFITGSAAGIIATAFLPDAFSVNSERKLKNIGFISGIIGKELKGDWKAVLKQVASFGYIEIETGNFLGDSAESYLAFLKETGLIPVAGGINFTARDEELLLTFGLLHKLEMKIAVTYWPWYSGGPFKLDECEKSAERLNYLGKLCHDNGLKFCWHNHDKEFIPMEKGLPFDFLMDNTDQISHAEGLCRAAGEDQYFISGRVHADQQQARPAAQQGDVQAHRLIAQIEDNCREVIPVQTLPGIGRIKIDAEDFQGWVGL